MKYDIDITPLIMLISMYSVSMLFIYFYMIIFDVEERTKQYIKIASIALFSLYIVFDTYNNFDKDYKNDIVISTLDYYTDVFSIFQNVLSMMETLWRKIILSQAIFFYSDLCIINSAEITKVNKSFKTYFSIIYNNICRWLVNMVTTSPTIWIKIRKLNYALGKKVHKAMIVCDPKIKKEECEVLWEEIEDISKQLILMKKKKDLEDLDFHI